MKSVFTIVFILAFAIIFISETNAQNTAEAIIIEQPKDVIECEGSLDQYLFVVAAPNQKQYKIAYRWLKDGRAITSWVEDFGQLTFDTLRYRMSGLYNAELFAFDPNWTSAYGNPFSFDSARVSPIVSSDKANIYVLQPPSFIKDIESQTIGLGQSATFTFDANIYGEHNMNDPTYWTDIQWFKDSVALIDGDRISGAQSSILTINIIQETNYSNKYRVRLSGDCDTIWSNEFAIYDEPKVLWWGASADREGCIGDTIVNWNLCLSTVPGIELEYQWLIDGVPFEDREGVVYGSKNDTIIFILDTIYDFNFDSKFQCEVWPKGYYQNVDTFSTINLNFLKPPIILSDLDDTYTIEEDGLLLLGIQSGGSDTYVYWRKDDEDWFWYEDTLRLGQISIEQSGKYQAMVYNQCDTVFSNIAEVIVTKKSIISGIENNSVNQEISIYPNPLTSNSTLTINPSASGKVSVILVDLLGNKLANIFEETIQQDQSESIKLNIDNIGLSSGTYYLIIQMGGRVETRQISILK